MHFKIKSTSLQLKQHFFYTPFMAHSNALFTLLVNEIACFSLEYNRGWLSPCLQNSYNQKGKNGGQLAKDFETSFLTVHDDVAI